MVLKGDDCLGKRSSRKVGSKKDLENAAKSGDTVVVEL